jgi:hypothetical protein
VGRNGPVQIFLIQGLVGINNDTLFAAREHER